MTTSDFDKLTTQEKHRLGIYFSRVCRTRMKQASAVNEIEFETKQEREQEDAKCK